MAAPEQVKQYLAYWFQLGKRVQLNGGERTYLPRPVIEGDRYSEAFERCWQEILSPQSGVCYLEGTEQSIDELLTSRWDLASCARCQMPVPVINLGVQPPSCPCSDLENWPSGEVPAPRSPISSSKRLASIRDRLNSIQSFQN